VDSPRVSVVMPARNAEPYVREAIESILRQSLPAFEIIVVDGGSTDRTASVVEELASDERRIRLHRQEHLGIVAGRNRGASLARAPYIAWLDADDVAVPRRLEWQVAFMDARPKLGALGGSVVATDKRLRPLLQMRYPTASTRIAATLLEGNALAASTAMIRASAYEAVGGCRSPFSQGGEDYDLWLRLSEAGYQLANLPDLLGYYRTHPAQVSSTGVERFVIPTVAVQLSARRRQAGRVDPYGAFERFTYDLFVREEGARHEVDTLLLDAAAGQATFLALVGQPGEARRLLDWACETTRSTSIRRRTRAKTLLAYGIVRWRTNQVPAALASMLGAVLLDPRFTAAMLARGARARLLRTA
jgi:glycosyltransferase involved in cell wall biosynthesis